MPAFGESPTAEPLTIILPPHRPWSLKQVKCPAMSTPAFPQRSTTVLGELPGDGLRSLLIILRNGLATSLLTTLLQQSRKDVIREILLRITGLLRELIPGVRGERPLRLDSFLFIAGLAHRDQAVILGEFRLIGMAPSPQL